MMPDKIAIRAREIDNRLSQLYPKAKTALLFSNPLELLVATILSAQCTDERVNQVTRSLFKKYKNAADYAEASQSELEADIYSTGFFRNKAKSIKGCCDTIISTFGGKMSDNLDDMLKLPGVGRKTANLVLGAVYGIPGIVADTHFIRLSQRLGLTKNTDPVKIEFDVQPLIPQKRWSPFSLELTLHGRAICHARKPKCSKCVLLDLCPFSAKSI